jgi:outer membrane protein assembly factor BamB
LSTGDRLLIASAKTGETLATFKGRVGTRLSPPVVLRSGVVAVADGEGLYALNAHGRELWTRPWGQQRTSGEWPVVEGPAALKDGTVIAAGLDGALHGVSFAGLEQWSVAVGLISTGMSAIATAVSPGLALVVSRPILSDATALTGIDLTSAPPHRRFVLRAGNEVATALASEELGIVVAGYADPRHHRGTTEIVVFNMSGAARWQIQRGLHDLPLAIAPSGDLLVTSQAPDGTLMSSEVEQWSKGGKMLRRSAVAGDVRYGTLI